MSDGRSNENAGWDIAMKRMDMNKMKAKRPAELFVPIIGEKRGFFISFEGVDGSGKSHHIDLLRQALQKTGFEVEMYRSPGTTKMGEQVRDITKDPKINLCQEAELLLMNADRAQLVREKIVPALAEGKIVLCDRYMYSTIVYQGFGRQIDMNIVKAVTQYAVGDVTPDITFVMSIPPEEEKKRKKNRGTSDRFEAEKEEYQNRIREGFKWLMSKEKDSKGKIIAIDSTGTIEQTHNEIYRCVAARVCELPSNTLKIDPASKIFKP